MPTNTHRLPLVGVLPGPWVGPANRLRNVEIHRPGSGDGGRLRRWRHSLSELRPSKSRAAAPRQNDKSSAETAISYAVNRNVADIHHADAVVAGHSQRGVQVHLDHTVLARERNDAGR